MDAYMSDKEQAKVIKDWLRKYAPSIVLGIIIALAVSYGWRFWQQRETNVSQTASVLYEQMLIAQNSKNAQLVDQIAGQLASQYKNTPYASFAALLQANQAVAQNNFDLAKQKLEWVIKKNNNKILVNLARLREARILLAQNQMQAASDLLSKVNDKTFVPSVNIVKGDIFATQGNKAAAIAAYRAALQQLPANAAVRATVQMKADALA